MEPEPGRAPAIRELPKIRFRSPDAAAGLPWRLPVRKIPIGQAGRECGALTGCQRSHTLHSSAPRTFCDFSFSIQRKLLLFSKFPVSHPAVSLWQLSRITLQSLWLPIIPLALLAAALLPTACPLWHET